MSFALPTRYPAAVHLQASRNKREAATKKEAYELRRHSTEVSSGPPGVYDGGNDGGIVRAGVSRGCCGVVVVEYNSTDDDRKMRRKRRSRGRREERMGIGYIDVDSLINDNFRRLSALCRSR